MEKRHQAYRREYGNEAVPLHVGEEPAHRAGRPARIIERGLIPTVPDLEWRTLGKPVVWLTEASTVLPSKAELAWLEAHRGTTFSDEQVAMFSKGHLAPPNGARHVRLTVKLSSQRNRLLHYFTWVSRSNHVLLNEERTRFAYVRERALDDMTAAARRDWWVYLDVVRPEQIVEQIVLPQESQRD